MVKAKKQWVWAPVKPSGVPDALKREVSAKGDKLVETYIKPAYVEPPPKNPRFNYLINVYTKWRGRCYYFMAKYACPGPNRISPSFDVGFARLEYAENGRFNLAYFRHTGKWWQVYTGLTLDEALNLIKEGDIFHP